MHATFNNQRVTNTNTKKGEWRDSLDSTCSNSKEREVVSYILLLLTLLTQNTVAKYTLFKQYSSMRCAR